MPEQPNRARAPIGQSADPRLCRRGASTRAIPHAPVAVDDVALGLVERRRLG